MFLCKPDENACNIPEKDYDIVTIANWYPLSWIKSPESKLKKVCNKEDRNIKYKV